MTDIYIDLEELYNFNSTEVHIAPITDKGKNWIELMFGVGATEVIIRKSGAGDLISAMERAGLTWTEPSYR